MTRSTAVHAPHRRTRFALVAALALAVVSLAPRPAHAIRVVTWNLLQYPQTAFAARQPNFYTVLANLHPDLLVVQELNDPSGRDSLLNALNATQPGQWSGNFTSVGAGEYYGWFWKPALMSISNITTIANPNGPRSFLRFTVRAVGYPVPGPSFTIYGVHFKAGNPVQTPADTATRRLECTTLRNSMNTLAAGTQFLLMGDSNFYGTWEGGYQRLTESQSDNDGRLTDPLPMPGQWNSNSSYKNYDTQSPCFSGCIDPNFSGGGMDDRFDLILPSAAMQDGNGFDMIPGSTVPYGNDGNHFNTDINGDGYNTAVGYPIATALRGASDHIPVYIEVQVPAKVSANSAIDFGRAIAGGAPIRNLSVANVALPPADELNYSLTAPAGFTAPPGSFTVNAGAPANVHALVMSANTVGVQGGTLVVASNAGDTTSKNVQLSGIVVRHAVPSLDSATVVTDANVDFGAHAIPQFGDADVRVYDQAYDALQARLSLDNATITGGAGRFSIAGGFTPGLVPASLADGTGRTLTLHFDSFGAKLDSTYTATLVFGTSDEPLPGAAVQPSLTFHLSATPVSGVAGAPGAVHVLRFEPARPNPLARSTTFAFELPRAQTASLAIYDLGGRRVASLAWGDQGAGRHQVTWSATDDRGARVAGGLYFVRFSTPGLDRVERVIVLP